MSTVERLRQDRHSRMNLSSNQTKAIDSHYIFKKAVAAFIQKMASQYDVGEEIQMHQKKHKIKKFKRQRGVQNFFKGDDAGDEDRGEEYQYDDDYYNDDDGPFSKTKRPRDERAYNSYMYCQKLSKDEANVTASEIGDGEQYQQQQEEEQYQSKTQRTGGEESTEKKPNSQTLAEEREQQDLLHLQSELQQQQKKLTDSKVVNLKRKAATTYDQNYFLNLLDEKIELLNKKIKALEDNGQRRAPSPLTFFQNSAQEESILGAYKVPQQDLKPLQTKRVLSNAVAQHSDTSNNNQAEAKPSSKSEKEKMIETYLQRNQIIEKIQKLQSEIQPLLECLNEDEGKVQSPSPDSCTEPEKILPEQTVCEQTEQRQYGISHIIKPGDWLCWHCGNLNYYYRMACNRCQRPFDSMSRLIDPNMPSDELDRLLEENDNGYLIYNQNAPRLHARNCCAVNARKGKSSGRVHQLPSKNYITSRIKRHNQFFSTSNDKFTGGSTVVSERCLTPVQNTNSSKTTPQLTSYDTEIQKTTTQADGLKTTYDRSALEQHQSRKTSSNKQQLSSSSQPMQQNTTNNIQEKTLNNNNNFINIFQNYLSQKDFNSNTIHINQNQLANQLVVQQQQQAQQNQGEQSNQIKPQSLLSQNNYQQQVLQKRQDDELSFFGYNIPADNQPKQQMCILTNDKENIKPENAFLQNESKVAEQQNSTAILGAPQNQNTLFARPADALFALHSSRQAYLRR